MMTDQKHKARPSGSACQAKNPPSRTNSEAKRNGSNTQPQGEFDGQEFTRADWVIGEILAIDPGSEQTAWLTYNTSNKSILDRGICSNRELLHLLSMDLLVVRHLAIEMVACYGMPVGKTVFETCVWIGRFIEAWEVNCKKHYDQVPYPANLIYRKDVKLHLCGTARAKDSNVRQALIDRFGPGKDKAIGTKKMPGPLYGIKKDLWSALAVAVTFADQHAEQSKEAQS